jgi:vanillate/3-O-methylgallate O-demethylase
MTESTLIPFNPVIPFHGDVTSFAMLGPFQGPTEYSGWRAESQSWKNGAYLGAAITWGPMYSVKGPDAESFFSDRFVNDFPGMPVGGFRHAIACDTQGRIMIDGVVLRIAQDEFYTCWLAQYVDPGSRQKEIRATVARFPYLQLERNDQIDVEKIPRLA